MQMVVKREHALATAGAVVEIGGRMYVLERLPYESDTQLAARKAFVFRAGVDVERRMAMSHFFHNVRNKGCTYPKPIMEALEDAGLRRVATHPGSKKSRA